MPVRVLSSFAGDLAHGATTGDPMVIALLGALALLVLVAVFHVPDWLMTVMKATVFLVFSTLAAYLFLQRVGGGPDLADPVVVTLLTTSGLVLLATFFILLIPPAPSRRTAAAPAPDEGRFELLAAVPAHATDLPSERAAPPDPRWGPGGRWGVSPEALGHELATDRSLLAVVTYVVIAQFGVFSSRTIAAPNADVGLAFATLFLLGALVFIRTSYHLYARGVAHLLVATLFGVGLSLVLGHYWSGHPWGTLLSSAYFATDAVVAVVTGVAVSLLMGSKG